MTFERVSSYVIAHEPESARAGEIDALLARSRALGSQRHVTNYGGGNTSAKADAGDVMWVKGSGGDLGALTESGLAVLDLARMRSLTSVYRGAEHEDEMVPLIEGCCVGRGGAAPSIDTAMHALLPPAHVDHLHPDAVIALATAADGESLTKQCFGDDVAWVPWRRPGFELGLEITRLFKARAGLRGVVLGGHGLTTWAPSSDACRNTSLELIERAAAFIAERGRDEPFGPIKTAPLPAAERRRAAAALAPRLRGRCSTDGHVIAQYWDDDFVLDFVCRAEAERLAALGTSCPDHFLRTRVRPMWLANVDALDEAHAAYREEYRAYYERWATTASPAMRGADPTVVLVPGIGMWTFGSNAHEARITGEFYLNAINVMRGAEAISRYEPIPESEKFGVEYWSLEEAKLRRRPPAPPLAGRIALVTGGASGIGLATAARLRADGAEVVVVDRDATDDGVVADVTDETAIDAAFEAACLRHGGVDIVVNNAGLSVSKPISETTVEDWDRQHGVMARGSFLVSRAAARVLRAQGIGGDIVYVASKNAVVAGPDNVAYGAAKADQAHQIRLLAAELGGEGIRVNGVNPDGVVQGSGIFAAGWGADRARVHGVPEEELGRFYAERTLLKREVLPEHVAAAIAVLVGGALSRTTGTIIPVDGGVPAAFLR